MKNHLFIITLVFISLTAYSQGFDSTQIGGDYPYALPFLGQKSYERGYKLPLPHGVMANSIYTKQNIVLENFEMGFTQGSTPFDKDDYYDFSDIIVFGPSTVRILTLNARVDTWILPFLGVSGFLGGFTGQTTVSLIEPIPLTSVTEMYGKYYGFNVIGIAPLGPINLAGDFSWTWTTNNYLSKPVQVQVAGLRVIKNFAVGKKPDMFVGVWMGVQFQFLAAKTEGSIGLGEALDPDEEFHNNLDEWYGGLSDLEKQLYGDKVYDAFENILTTTVHYRFDKRLEKNWNYLIGGQFQINRRWQLRAELGFIPGKYQAMVSMNYRFGI